jgi:hypothetical protein
VAQPAAGYPCNDPQAGRGGDREGRLDLLRLEDLDGEFFGTTPRKSTEDGSPTSLGQGRTDAARSNPGMPSSVPGCPTRNEPAGSRLGFATEPSATERAMHPPGASH